MDVDSSSAGEMPTELGVVASLETVDLLPIMSSINRLSVKHTK